MYALDTTFLTFKKKYYISKKKSEFLISRKSNEEKKKHHPITVRYWKFTMETSFSTASAFRSISKIHAKK